MNKHLIITSILLLMAFLNIPPAVNAQQDIQQDPNNQAPANEVPGQIGGTTDNRDEGFNWWLLLPLLAVPLILLYRRSNKEDDKTPYRDQGMAGSKGGRTNRDQNDDVLGG